MNKIEFLAAVERGLAGLSENDIKKSLDYYGEMIDDRIEDGMSEEEAVAAMGDAGVVVDQILAETPLPKLIKATAKPRHALRAWEIVLIVLGSPVWLPLLIAVTAVVFSVFVVLYSLIFSLYAADLGIAASGLISLASAPFAFYGSGALGTLLLIGAGLALSGFSVIFFFVCTAAAKGIIKLSKLFLKGIKSIFIKREKNT